MSIQELDVVVADQVDKIERIASSINAGWRSMAAGSLASLAGDLGCEASVLIDRLIEIQRKLDETEDAAAPLRCDEVLLPGSGPVPIPDRRLQCVLTVGHPLPHRADNDTTWEPV